MPLFRVGLTESPLNALMPKKMADIFQTIYLILFSWMKMSEFRFEFHRNLFLGGQIDKKSALVQVMAWRKWGDKLFSEPMAV